MEEDVLIDKSAVMRQINEAIYKIARADGHVCIFGESGSGKEVVARKLHLLMNLKTPFVAVNCGAITPSLIESELFGHEKGAFTHALQQHRGVFEQAQNGTLFLDEIDTLDIAMQPRLLRVLESRSFLRVGGEAPLTFKARVVSACSRDLRAAVEKGIFRSDLFYRLNVFQINIPPLRERREDIGPLADFFIDFYNKKYKKNFTLSKETQQKMLEYAWPGNVRELKNAIERAMIFAEGQILPEHLQIGPVQNYENRYNLKLKEAVSRFKGDFIKETLKNCNGNQTKAAKLLGLQRSYLARLIVQLGIKDEKQ